jgi:hypothetical protein
MKIKRAPVHSFRSKNELTLYVKLMPFNLRQNMTDWDKKSGVFLGIKKPRKRLVYAVFQVFATID